MKEQYTLVANKKKYELMNEDPVIRTFLGNWVNVFDPDPETFIAEDIAHALSHQCRFSGHLRQFYSVANHSIYCYQTAHDLGLSIKEQLTALMHDCSEAYLVDIPRPIKREFSQYKIIEGKLMNTLSERFGFLWPLPESIANIDNLALQREWDYLMIENKDAPKVPVYSQEYAEEYFLDIFRELIHQIL